MNEELIRRLRDAQGGMHKCTVDEADKYRCDRGTCACYDRHVELLEESIAALEAASLNERRYLWLRDSPAGSFLSLGHVISKEHGLRDAGELLDAAIDAALSGEGVGG